MFSRQQNEFPFGINVVQFFFSIINVTGGVTKQTQEHPPRQDVSVLHYVTGRITKQTQEYPPRQDVSVQVVYEIFLPEVRPDGTPATTHRGPTLRLYRLSPSLHAQD